MTNKKHNAVLLARENYTSSEYRYKYALLDALYENNTLSKSDSIDDDISSYSLTELESLYNFKTKQND